LVEGKLAKNLKEFLSKEISEKEMKKESLIVGDAKLGKDPRLELAFWICTVNSQCKQAERDPIANIHSITLTNNI